MLSVGRVMEQSAVTYATAPKSSEEISEKKDTTLAADATDKFVRSGASFTPAYTKATVTDNRSSMTGSGTDPNSNIAPDRLTKQKEQAQADEQGKVGQKTEADVPQFKSVTQAKNEMMKDMVMQMLTGQVEDSRKTDAMKELEEILSSYSDDEERDENYWNADETANRILGFAKELAGDDDEAFGTLKDAFEKAFTESEKLFGGKGSLPSVSYDTYDKVQQGFDDWEKQIAEKRAENGDIAAAQS